MRVGLVDVDGHHYPNLALMKLSAWHKAQGDAVSFAEELQQYDKVYMAKVFTWTPDNPYFSNADRGGSGYRDYAKVLPDEIEHMCPDYSLYGIKDTAYGFATRGCIRHCSFCLVHDKEGYIRPHADVQEFLDGRKKVILMDNNIIACDHGIRQLEYIRDNGIACDCNQGLDARILCKSDYLCKLIANLKPFIRIACDCKSEIEPCHHVINKVLSINPKVTFNVYCILTDDKDDSMNRVMQFRKYGHRVIMYAPPFKDFTDRKQIIPQWQNDVSRWACNRFLYYRVEFSDYKKTFCKKQSEDLCRENFSNLFQKPDEKVLQFSEND